MKKMKYKNALVTGGAGFIGSHLARALVEKGMSVAVIDDLSVGRIENLPDGVKFIKGDILDLNLLRSVIKEHDIEVVFHEAAKVSVRSSLPGFHEDASTNIMGTLNVLKACAESSVRKLVFASSMAVYADSGSPTPISENHIVEPISPYGISKLASEKYCLLVAREFDMDCVVLRYFNTFGIGQSYTPYVGVITIFIERLIDGLPLTIYGDGEQRRDFVHVDDIVNANVLAMDSDVKERIFNIGTGIATSVNELAEMLVSKIDQKAKILHERPQPGELRNAVADITLSKKTLGYTGNCRLDDRIDELIEWKRRKRYV